MRHGMTLLGVFAFSALTFAQPPKAGEVPAERGLYVAVPHPLTSDGLTRVKNLVSSEVGKAADRPTWVVFDFTSDGKDATNPDPELPGNLARFIGGLNVKTVAYFTKKVSGHTVLPALACRDVVMGKDASIGEVVGPGEPPLDGDLARSFYEPILGKVRPTQLAAVRKMYTPTLRLRKAKKGDGEVLVDLAKLDGATNPRSIAGVSEDGVGLYKADVAMQLGIARGIRDSVPELADLLGISPASLRFDPLDGRPPEAFRYTLTGSIDHGVKEAVRRALEGIVSRKGNLVFLQLECSGGDLDAARELAEELTNFQRAEDGTSLKIIAFVPNTAPDTAAIIALGCTEIVLSRRTDAKNGDDAAPMAEIGDFSAALADNPQAANTLGASLRDLALKQGYPPLLAEGMVNKDLVIVFARDSVEKRKTRLMTKAEYDAANGKWVQLEEVKARGKLLKLTAKQAEDYGLAKTIETRSLADLAAKYGVEPSRVKDATPAWLDRLAAFLRIPTVTVMLFVIGVVGLILELKVPGAMIPGVLSALAFICIFWAHTQFSGQVAVLAGLLFLLGLILILLEVFVLPGIGAALVLGIILIVGSVALVTVDRIPETGTEWTRLGGKMATYLFATIGAFILALIIARYLPSLPIANKMFLPPADTGPDTDATLLPGVAKAAALLGAIGMTSTVLRPAGTVQFGDEFVDVVTDGGYIAAGTKVQVIEVEGTRIVVKAV